MTYLIISYLFAFKIFRWSPILLQWFMDFMMDAQQMYVLK